MENSNKIKTCKGPRTIYQPHMRNRRRKNGNKADFQH